MLVRAFSLLAPAAAAAICLLRGDEGFSFVWRFVLFGLAFFLGLCLLLVLFAYICSRFVDPSKPQEKIDPFYKWLTLEVAALVLFLGGVHIRTSGFAQIPKDRLFLLVGNHRSNFDPIAALWALRRFDIAFISKPENFRIPIAGRLIHKCCFLPIDREDDRKAITTILKASDYIKNGVCSVCIYPEGTRNRTGTNLLPLKSGSFKIAQRTRAPIVVAAIDRSERIRRRWPLPTRVDLTIAGVIEQSGDARVNTHELAAQTQTMLEKTLRLPLTAPETIE